VPISFVSDHVETLYEINIEARKLAERLGIQGFRVTMGLNGSPTFIRALADLVLRALAGRDPW
jgi:ferrochelatase